MYKSSNIILGIDPGTIIMGYGVLYVKGNILKVVDMGVLKLSNQKDHYEKLNLIHKKVNELITTYKPNHFAIEAPFFGKNVQSMLKLGRAQGIAISCAIEAGLKVVEYSPKKVKQSVTGNGNADKLQVFKMLQQILSIVDTPKYYDATDALAVALCHYLQSNPKSVQSSTKTKPKKIKTSWESFAQKNPDRIKLK